MLLAPEKLVSAMIPEENLKATGAVFPE